MNKKTCIYIVRHGESTHNRDGLIGGGDENPPLTDEGRRQAHEAKRKLAHIKFDVVYSSDLERAVDTASIIHGQEVPLANRLVELRERTFGELDGKQQRFLDDMAQAIQALPHHERRHYVHAKNMESDHALAERYINALTGIATANSGKNILIGAHGSAIRILLIELGWATYEELPGGSFKNGNYAKLVFDGKKLTVDEVVGVVIPKTN